MKHTSCMIFDAEDRGYVHINNINTGKFLHTTSEKITRSDIEKNRTTYLQLEEGSLIFTFHENK